MEFCCGICGKDHSGATRDFAMLRPDAFVALPKSQKEAAAHNDDLCAFDGQYFVRGVLEVRVTDAGGDFGWGLWAQVSEASFRRILKLWDADVTDVPAFAGTIANQIPGLEYAGLLGKRCRVQLRNDGDRPALTLVSASHRLAVEQRDGITAHRVAEIAAALAPSPARKR